MYQQSFWWQISLFYFLNQRKDPCFDSHISLKSNYSAHVHVHRYFVVESSKVIIMKEHKDLIKVYKYMFIIIKIVVNIPANCISSIFVLFSTPMKNDYIIQSL